MYKIIIGIICTIILLFQYKKSQVLSSVSIFCFCYFLIFVVYPASLEYSFNNEHLIDICALIGIICFSGGLFFGSKLKINSTKNNKNYNFPPFYLSTFLFMICFSISIVIVLKVYGISAIRNLFSGGITSRELSQSMSNASLFSFSQHTMIPCVLCMWISSKNKKQKAISLAAIGLYAIETLFLSFTRIFLISTFLIIFFYEMRNVSRNKQVLYSLIGVVSIVLLLVVMNYIRCLGLSYELKMKTLLNLDVIFECTDFSASYNMLNKLLNYPSPHISLLVYLKPIFVFIPRTIWPSKPESLNVQVMRYVNPIAASNGLSSGISILGEGYATLDFFGMFFSCFVWGIVCSYLDKKYYNRLNNNVIISTKNIYYYIFAIFIIISAQRGDWSVYLSTILYFYFLPIYVLSKIKYRVKKND